MEWRVADGTVIASKIRDRRHLLPNSEERAKVGLVECEPFEVEPVPAAGIGTLDDKRRKPWTIFQN